MDQLFIWREYMKNNPSIKNKKDAIIDYLTKNNLNISSVKYNNNCIINQKDKLIFLWSLRSASAVVCQVAFESMGILDGALKFNPFVHKYRKNVYLKNAINIKDVIYDSNYRVIKVVRNPYARAVSLLRIAHRYGIDCSFHELMKMLTEKKIKIHNVLGHCKHQYLQNEEMYIDYYIKIENPATEKIYEDTSIKLNFDKKSLHHTTKINYTEPIFIGNTKYKLIKQMPTDYKLFYNDEIKKLVEELYEIDIIKYNYSF